MNNNLPQFVAPKFNVKIPSTGKVVKMRSMLAKELKILGVKKILFTAVLMRDKNSRTKFTDLIQTYFPLAKSTAILKIKAPGFESLTSKQKYPTLSNW